MVEVIDNFLKKEEFNVLTEFMLGPSFPMMAGEVTHKDPFIQFSHLFFTIFEFPNVCSPYADCIIPILNKIRPCTIMRVKSNCLVRTENIIKFNHHVDVEGFEGRTGIFYLNTNNGKTIFENGEEIDSIANRFISFDSSMRHTGTTCTDAHRRDLINFNYTTWKQ